MSNPGTTNVSQWERYMTISANNLAWVLATKERCKSEDTERFDETGMIRKQSNETSESGG